MIQAQISDQSYLCGLGKATETLHLSYFLVKAGRRIHMLSQEEEFSHLHSRLVPLLVENIGVHICIYCVDSYVSTSLSTFIGRHQK